MEIFIYIAIFIGFIFVMRLFGAWMLRIDEVIAFTKTNIGRIKEIKFKSFMKKLLQIIAFRCVLLCVFLTLNMDLIAQDKSISLYPTIGITWRSSAKNLGRDDGAAPRRYQKNLQGFSINPGIQIQMNTAPPFTLEYSPNFRYDVIKSDDSFYADNRFEKGFLIDHNFNLILRMRIAVGIGMTIVNSGAEFEQVKVMTPEYQDIEFLTHNIFVIVPVKKILNLEIKAMYVPKNFPEDPEGKYLMLSLKVYYKFNFLNKSSKRKTMRNAKHR